MILPWIAQALKLMTKHISSHHHSLEERVRILARESEKLDAKQVLARRIVQKRKLSYG